MRLFRAALIALILIRLPSLVQPAGADQGLYAYVASRIAQGEMAYRDAWDQKPPAIHYTYALIRVVSHHEAAIAAADLVAAVLIALMLVVLGRKVSQWPAAGELSALLFLGLSNPALTRLGGIRVRAQCETFMALFVTAALVSLCRHSSRSSVLGHQSSVVGPRSSVLGPQSSVLGHARWVLLAGVLFGVAALYKYNAIVYLAVGVALLFTWDRQAQLVERCRRAVLLVAGVTVPLIVAAIVFAVGGAIRDLADATVVYNLWYSGDTYVSRLDFVRYLITFPIRHARIDPLWLLGGLGSAVLLIQAVGSKAADRPRTEDQRPRTGSYVVLAWVACACIAIALNGSRGLPQYFVQAAPALALAAGLASAWVWQAVGRVWRIALIVLLTIAVTRVTLFGKVIDYLIHDTRYMTGHLSKADHLARYGGPTEKFSALAVHQLGEYLGRRTPEGERIFIFGFAGMAYVKAERQSASRFFWSRPIVFGFKADSRNFGPRGLLEDLNGSPPRFVALEHRDEGMDLVDSATYFKSQLVLIDWLRSGYEPIARIEDYEIWERIRER